MFCLHHSHFMCLFLDLCSHSAVHQELCFKRVVGIFQFFHILFIYYAALLIAVSCMTNCLWCGEITRTKSMNSQWRWTKALISSKDSRLHAWVGKQCTVECDDSCPEIPDASEAYSGGGWQEIYRKVVVAPDAGGLSCPDLSRTKKCSQKKCPVDCIMSEWEEFGLTHAACSPNPRMAVFHATPMWRQGLATKCHAIVTAL